MKYTEEEKKAIEDLKKLKIGIEFLNNYLKSNGNYENIDNTDIASIDIILNLIEKQQKEIERLKEHLNQYYDGKLFTSNQLRRIEKEHNKYYIHKDKIREKIEEYAGLKEIDIKAYDEQVRPLKELLGE